MGQTQKKLGSAWRVRAQNVAFHPLPSEMSFFLLYLEGLFSWICGRGSRPWSTQTARFGFSGVILCEQWRLFSFSLSLFSLLFFVFFFFFFRFSVFSFFFQKFVWEKWPKSNDSGRSNSVLGTSPFRSFFFFLVLLGFLLWVVLRFHSFCVELLGFLLLWEKKQKNQENTKQIFQKQIPKKNKK